MHNGKLMVTWSSSVQKMKEKERSMYNTLCFLYLFIFIHQQKMS